MQLFAQVQPTPDADRLKLFDQKRAAEGRSRLKNVSFRNIGPSVMSGRVVDVEVNPADPTEFYAAYATGGLWHTRNNGQSFRPVFDNEDVHFIGDIAVDWTHSSDTSNRIIWVGTGEVNSSRSSYAGIGIYKTTNGGKTWIYLELPGSHHTGKILLHPTDSNVAWVAAMGHLYSSNKERGVFKTVDGGRTWKQSLFIDANTGVVEMEIDPSNPQVLYAAAWYRLRKAWDFEESGITSAIYKSADGGATWKKLSVPESGFPIGNHVGRIGLAISPKQSNVIYAIVDNNLMEDDTAVRDTTSGKFARRLVGAEVYKSVDAGVNWKKTHQSHLNIFRTYGYYFGKIYAAPSDVNKIYILGYEIMSSVDGGKNFKMIDRPNVHVDHHALWINPKREGHLINGNDGGVNITYDDGDVWFKANMPPVGQFYAITVDNAKPYNVFGGLQDNGTWYGSSKHKENNDWTADGDYGFKSIGGGDGMQVQVDPRDNKTVYSGMQFGYYNRRNLDGGKSTSIKPRSKGQDSSLRFNWQTPIHLSRHQPDVIYYGSNKFHRSLNKGDTMITLSADLTKGSKAGDVPFGTLTTISESPLRFGLIYVGSDDGNIHITRDGGYTWSAINKNLPQHLWVSRVVASKYKEGRVYAALNGYRNDHFKPYLFVSDDYGTSWKSLGADLPDEPLNVIAEDPVKDNILYVGSDGGIYVSADNGKSFMSWNTGLPKSVPVHDIVIQERELEIVLGTHGRSLYIASLAALHEALK